MNKSEIMDILSNCKGISFNVEAEDLMLVFEKLVKRYEDQVQATESKNKEIILLPREQVMEKLNVSPATLWRWSKIGYLVPVNIGGQRRYRSTDIDLIIEGKK